MEAFLSAIENHIIVTCLLILGIVLIGEAWRGK